MDRPTENENPASKALQDCCVVTYCWVTMEIVFGEGVQHRLRFCIDHLSLSVFFIYNWGNRESRSGPSQASRVGGG
jgi:hypothetical protein